MLAEHVAVIFSCRFILLTPSFAVLKDFFIHTYLLIMILTILLCVVFLMVVTTIIIYYI